MHRRDHNVRVQVLSRDLLPIIASKRLEAFVDTNLTLPFLKKVKFQENGCWLWLGQKVVNPRYLTSPTGYQYGFYTYKLKRSNGSWVTKGQAAHRFAYERIRGPVPRRFDLDHLCENKLCVNPDHLEPISHRDHMHRHLFGRSAL